MEKKALKKVSTKEVNSSKIQVGEKIKGIFKGRIVQKFSTLDEKKGEIVEKDMVKLLVEQDNGDRFAVLADKGLQQQIENSGIKEGQYFEAVKGEKTPLSKGRTMNQWDIYA